MTSNNGTQLEALAALIEGQLATGFTVTRRKRVFEDGVQVAEFDIVISGRVGSADCTWLVECRDRPSEGAAPAEWIEQLVGRRQRFRLNGVMAVSSTGFSPGAVSLANHEGIALRRLDTLTAEDVSGWLPVNAPMVIHNNHFDAVRVVLEADDSVDVGDEPRPVKDKSLIDCATGEAVSLLEVWRRVAEKHDLWRDIPENGEERRFTLLAEDYIDDRYRCELNGQSLNVVSIAFDAVLRAVIPTMPLVEAAEYASGQGSKGREAIARMGRWRLPGDGPVKELTFIGFYKRAGNDS